MKLPRTIRGGVGATVLGLGLSMGGLPLAVAHAQTSPASSATAAAVAYVDTTYPGSGQAAVLKTEADVEHGVPVYDVRVVAPDGHTYVVHVRQSTDAVLSANLAENQTSGASGPTAPAASGTNTPGAADDRHTGEGAPGAGATDAAHAGFTSYWVQAGPSGVTLWSGPNGHAIAFGTVGQGSVFAVVRPQNGTRLFVYNPLTHNYAYVDAAAVQLTARPAPTVGPTGDG